MKNDVNSLRYKYTRAVTLEKVDLSPGMHTQKKNATYIYTVELPILGERECIRRKYLFPIKKSENDFASILSPITREIEFLTRPTVLKGRGGGGRMKSRTTSSVTQESGEKYPLEKGGVGVGDRNSYTKIYAPIENKQ